ncbi:LysM peptidoglycan-binding domain-containing protein [Thaumasiovibrio sp. DFM-14]|uniref:LysM peptidoglycan-binding domain-containing protein n=1 Tax=Thaumasiovibrio sp. DFM-14 TaxID=3384792 RepID=UPI00399F4B1B
MKTKFFVASALLLAGCQLSNTALKTQQPETNETKEETTTPINEASAQLDTLSSTNKLDTPSDVNATGIDNVVETEKQATPQEQEDVWRRISMQLSLPVPNGDPRVEHYKNWYLRNPSHLQTVAKRAEPFLHLITEKVEARGFPIELALLPIVESSFDQFAYSHGRAAGLWQITPPTGRSFGLEQNWWYDGRRDVDRSTDGALDLLDYLNKKFSGNWLHALAAYNTGEGRVFRAIRSNRDAGKSTDFWSLSLPRETSDYVPKLLAVADVIANAEQYGMSIPAIANKPVVKVVEPGIQMDLALAAKYAEMTVAELQSYNPAYNQWATAPDGPNHLLLPLDKANRFTENLTANNQQGMNLIRYQIQPGDTLSVLAQKHDTTTALIMRANDMDSPSLRAGRHIMIPVALKDDSSIIANRSSVLASSRNTHGNGYRVEYEVKAGDSLWTIARNEKVSIDNLTRWNGITRNSTIRVGQKLTMWKDTQDGGIIRTISYQVRSGDNLSVIANRYKVRVSDLMKWNNLDSNSYLQPGQRLTLHVDVTKVSV